MYEVATYCINLRRRSEKGRKLKKSQKGKKRLKKGQKGQKPHGTEVAFKLI